MTALGASRRTAVPGPFGRDEGAPQQQAVGDLLELGPAGSHQRSAGKRGDAQASWRRRARPRAGRAPGCRMPVPRGRRGTTGVVTVAQCVDQASSGEPSVQRPRRSWLASGAYRQAFAHGRHPRRDGGRARQLSVLGLDDDRSDRRVLRRLPGQPVPPSTRQGPRPHPRLPRSTGPVTGARR